MPVPSPFETRSARAPQTEGTDLTLVDQLFTSGQPPSFIGRKAWSAGMVARTL
jgi:hypothetical protein